MTLYVGPSKLNFVWPRWCRQVTLFADWNLGHFPFWGAHLQKGLKSNLSGRKQSTEQLNGHFPEKQRHSKICQDTGVICSHRICDFRDQKMGLIKNCVKEQVISGPKKTMWKKLGPRSQKCLFWFNVGLKSKPPSIWSLEISQKSMKMEFKDWFNNASICDSLFWSPCA